VIRADQAAAASTPWRSRTRARARRAKHGSSPSRRRRRARRGHSRAGRVGGGQDRVHHAGPMVEAGALVTIQAAPCRGTGSRAHVRLGARPGRSIDAVARPRRKQGRRGPTRWGGGAARRSETIQRCERADLATLDDDDTTARSSPQAPVRSAFPEPAAPSLPNLRRSSQSTTVGRAKPQLPDNLADFRRARAASSPPGARRLRRAGMWSGVFAGPEHAVFGVRSGTSASSTPTQGLGPKA
jgi:hypothetical protein